MDDCATPAVTSDAELVAVSTGGCLPSPETDLLFDVRHKGGLREGAVLDGAGAWSVEHVWRDVSCGDRSVFVIVTAPPRSGTLGCRILVDSDIDSVSAFGSARTWKIGDWMPSGQDAGLGVVLPGDRTSYTVRSGRFSGTFPERRADGSVRIAFAPVLQVNPNRPAPDDCSLAGAVSYMEGLWERSGPIVGYNVYRIPACRAVEGTVDDFASAIASPLRGSWVGFVDTRTIRLAIANDGSVSPGPNDLAPVDEVELVNPDGRMDSGDEVLLFTDRAAASRPDPWRAPRANQDYWYAIQPALRGHVADFASVSFGSAGRFAGDHRRDIDGDGALDSVDGDLARFGGVEFISPQAEAGNGSLDGLGLTVTGLPLLSSPMFARALVPTAFPPECVAIPRFP